MTALELWLAYVAVVGWGLFGFMCWLTWNLNWVALRRLRESMRRRGA